MKNVLLICILVFLSSCETIKQVQQPLLRVLELSGTPYERGFTHGSTLKEEIHQIITQWSKISEMQHGLDMNAMKSDFVQRTRFKQSIEKWTPDLLDEMKGIADGAGIEFDLIYLLQISEEFGGYIPSYGLDSTDFRCTSIGVNPSKSRPTIIAQNMEPPRFLQGFPTLLHITNDSTDLESYVFTFPGFIGLNGLNDRSIAVTANGLPDYFHKREGLPVSCVIRGLLEQTTFQEATSFLHSIEHARAQFYIIGSRERAAGFESDAENIFVFKAPGHPSVTYHTNQYLVADYESPYCSRLQTLKEELTKRDFRIGHNDIKAILSSNRYNAGRPISSSNTYGCTIMHLSDMPKLYIAPGRPDEHPFTLFMFRM